MLDHSPSSGPGEEKKPLGRREKSSAEAGRPKKPSLPSSPEGKEPPRRKAAIVNRRGPSEIDRALRMNHAVNPRSKGSDRKVVEGSTSRGTVVRIDRAKGFGFLIDAAGEQRFFHRSAVLDGGFANLKEQQTVEFEARGDERGARAIKVHPVSPSASPASKAPQRPQSSPKAPKSSGWRSDLMPFRSGTTPPSGRKRI